MTFDGVSNVFDGFYGFVGRRRSIEKDCNDGFVAFVEFLVETVGNDFGRKIGVF